MHHSLWHVGLGIQHGAGLQEDAHNQGVILGDLVRTEEARRRRAPAHMHLVLDAHRYAVKGSHWLACLF